MAAPCAGWCERSAGVMRLADEIKSQSWLRQKGKKAELVKLELDGQTIVEQKIPKGSITVTINIA